MKKHISDKEKSMIEELNNLLDKKGAELIDFKYYQKIFGNIVTTIRYNNEEHVFITDRGEIIHNQNMICNSSYHIAGKSDTFPKLLEIIDKELV